MKIASTGNAGHKMELTSKSIPPGVEWIWVDSVAGLASVRDAGLFIDLEFAMHPDRVAALGSLPSPVIVHSVTHTLPEITVMLSSALDRHHARSTTVSSSTPPFARINAWPGFLQRGVWELAAADPTTGEFLCRQLSSIGLNCRLVADTPGLIGARILSSVINEAYFTLQDKVSTREEIDTAMRLGTNYPWGPFEWSEKIGLHDIHELLDTLSRSDGRYTPAGALSEELQG